MLANEETDSNFFKRNMPVPTSESNEDWKFTDFRETRQINNCLTFIRAGEEKCEFGKKGKRARLF